MAPYVAVWVLGTFEGEESSHSDFGLGREEDTIGGEGMEVGPVLGVTQEAGVHHRITIHILITMLLNRQSTRGNAMPYTRDYVSRRNVYICLSNALI